MKTIARYFSEDVFNNVKKDLKFLFKAIENSKGELDFQIRPNNKFNLYYKGNSLADVSVKTYAYEIKTHRKFGLVESLQENLGDRFKLLKVSHKSRNDYVPVTTDRKLIHACLQSKVMNHLKANIKKVNYGEEIAFEQTLMTDNLGRKDFIIIDRQVQGGGLPGRMDLLAVKKNPNGKYSLLVLEVKLGNNKELEGEVLEQLDKYVFAINKNFSAFKECYEKNYAQKKELGLFPKGPKLIEIDGEVEGKIVVGSYSKIGEEAIKKLKELSDKYSIQQFSHIIK